VGAIVRMIATMMIPCSAQRRAPRNRRHGGTSFHTMDLRVAPEKSEKSGSGR
jgi:hypothetical protein